MNLTPEQLLNIIKGCSGTVKRLVIKGRNIEIDFIEPHQPLEQSPSTHNQGQNKVAEPVTEIPDEKDAMKEPKPGIDQDIIDEAELIDELNITDPLRMEDLIVLKEVVSEEKVDSRS
jgi:hypothetical protein